MANRYRGLWPISSLRKQGPSMTRRVVLAHHDDWLPGFAGAPDMEPIRQAFKERTPGVELLEPGYLAATPIMD